MPRKKKATEPTEAELQAAAELQALADMEASEEFAASDSVEEEALFDATVPQPEVDGDMEVEIEIEIPAEFQTEWSPKGKQVKISMQSIVKELWPHCPDINILAEALEVPRQAIYNAARNAGLLEGEATAEGEESNTRAKKGSVKERIEELHREGLTASEIAKALNVRYQQVYNALKGQINFAQAKGTKADAATDEPSAN